jgi:hypothetical protein
LRNVDILVDLFRRYGRWINLLMSYSEHGGTIQVQRFLVDAFFKRSDGRALILQNVGKFAFIYLDIERYPDSEAQEAEVKSLIEFVLTIRFLQQQSMIALLEAPPPDRNHMFQFVGEFFVEPRITKDRMILNDRGDFSIIPGEIKDISGKPIYKGREIRGDFFSKLSEVLRGVVYLTDAMVEIYRHIEQTETFDFAFNNKKNNFYITIARSRRHGASE